MSRNFSLMVHTSRPVVVTSMPNKQACMSFTVVATSVPNERLFSKAGGVITKIKIQLTGSHLGKILLLTDIPKHQGF